MKVLAEDGVEAHLSLHGSNLELQPPAYREEFEELLEEVGETVTMLGRYSKEQLPALMANVDWVVVPSIWWENSPLVIQEAFLHGRPAESTGIAADPRGDRVAGRAPPRPGAGPRRARAGATGAEESAAPKPACGAVSPAARRARPLLTQTPRSSTRSLDPHSLRLPG